MTGKDNDISIWFFIGLSSLVNGVLITGAGLYELIRPPRTPTIALYHLHANVWWGGLLWLFGLVYCVVYAPRRAKSGVAAAGGGKK